MCDRAKLSSAEEKLRILGTEAILIYDLVEGDLTLARDAARFRLALEMLTLGVEARLHWMDTKDRTPEQDAARSPRAKQET